MGWRLYRSLMGMLVRGDVLVSNFNDSGQPSKAPARRSWRYHPGGSVKQFAQIDAANLPGSCPGGVGLTTALVVTNSGWVIVGSLPTTDGTAATAQAGCLIVLNSMGQAVKTITNGLINGPWDMTALDGGKFVTLFVTNVLNGTVAANGRRGQSGQRDAHRAAAGTATMRRRWFRTW